MFDTGGVAWLAQCSKHNAAHKDMIKENRLVVAKL
jgi:hypothetical protein